MVIEIDSKSFMNGMGKRISEIEAGVKKAIEESCDRATKDAQNEFRAAKYDGVNDVEVSLESEGNEYSIVAKGQAVAFIEFGAGITYGNGYPGVKPPEVSAIGTYGQGRGARNGWSFKYQPGSTWSAGGGPIHYSGKNSGKPMVSEIYAFTQGNPPNAVMYHVASYLKLVIPEYAKKEMK